MTPGYVYINDENTWLIDWIPNWKKTSRHAFRSLFRWYSTRTWKKESKKERKEKKIKCFINIIIFMYGGKMTKLCPSLRDIAVARAKINSITSRHVIRNNWKQKSFWSESTHLFPTSISSLFLYIKRWERKRS